MSTHRNRDPAWIGVLDRVYGAALWLYPSAHRRRFGAQMRQALRDRCREAARAERGPWSVLLGELLPDLVVSVGSEHFDAIHLETNPMKRLLYVLVATFIAAVALHGQVTPALDAVHGWNNARLGRAAQRTYSSYMAGLATRVANARHDVDAQITAAILFHEAASGSSARANSVRMVDALGAAATEALQARADAAFAVALKADDRRALWLAVRACPARADICQAKASLTRLEALDGDNGAVWALDLRAAQVAGDTTRARVALARIATANRFATYDASTAHDLLKAFDTTPARADMVPAYTASQSDVAAALAWTLGDGGYLFDEYSELKPLSDFCRSADSQVHAQRRADCRAAGKLMVARGDLYVGYIAWMRNADPGEEVTAREAFREHCWRAWGYRQHEGRIVVTPAMWRASWATAGDANNENLRFAKAAHVPAQAPATFQLRPEQYDPWY
ncbi:MAG: hypothetical protein JSS44_05875 [Proteobacteria bacterium]|nr:hypothetical protein [Pseudomonadota bacterium]MBS0463380.1 hypothetical protein [Pseudomonadota bacterium]